MDTAIREGNAEKNKEAAASFWFARNSKSLIFVIITLAVVGAYLAFSIPVAVFPSTDFPRIVIGIDNGVMPIDQMLVVITRPVEETVNGIPGIQSVRSITSRGSAEVDLFFDWNVDMFQTLQLVDAALAKVQASLPPTAKIESHRLTFASFPIIGYSLTSDTLPETQLWEMATYDIKPRLNKVSGVATVLVQGGEEPEFQITPDPAKMLEAGVTVTDLLDAVRRTNLVDSPGLIESNHQLVLGLVSGQVQDASQLSQIVVKNTATGIPIRIGDLGSVAPSVKPVYTVVTANGKPGVLLSINRQPDSNTVKVAADVHAAVEQLRKELPRAVKLEPYYDQSNIVNESIKSVRDAILIGLALASIVLVVFLHDWGSSVVAGLVIPVTLMITMIVLKVMGQSFNLMTLGGLAAAVGLVIDDAIVVVENIVLHRDAGQGRFEAVRSALKEITAPLIGSTITPIVVFLPLISITGVTGSFFRALAVTMSVSLLSSLALALTWTPTLSHYFVRRKSGEGENSAPVDSSEEMQRLMAAEEASMTGLFGRVIRFYERWLRRALEHPMWLVGFSVLLVIISYLSYRALGTGLLPHMDEGGFIIDYITPAGTSLQETNRIVGHMEEIVKSIPEVESISRRTGLQLGLAAVTEANTGDISVKLKAKRSRSGEEVIDDLRAKIKQAEPVVDVEFPQLLQDMIGDLTSAPEPIVVKLFAQDPEVLRDAGPRVADAIGKIDGVTDILNGIDNTISGPAVQFDINSAAAARAGFTPEEVAVDAAAVLEGEPAATPVIAHDRAYVVRVRFPAQNRASLDTMSNTLINSSTGKTATLGSIAKLTQIPGQMEIRRENLQRLVEVTARLEGTDLGTGMAKVKKAVADLHLPSSIRVEYGGTYQEQQKSFHDLVFVFVLALVFVFAVLLFEFRTFSAPAAILASAILSTSGVFLALLITHTQFNVASFMGLIMVVGIVAKNGILLLDADQRFRNLGMSAEEAMIQAGRRRLRPIVMTALAAIAGMFPLALALGAGSQMLQPLAISVIGGILISMALSLVLTPAVHFYLTRQH